VNRAINIYIAGPLFSVAEREFNKRLAEALKSGLGYCIISLPQEFAATISGQPEFLDLVFEHSLKSIRESDAVVAVLDGSDVDSGTSVEIGYAYANRKPILGIRTDFRSSEDKGVNLMVSKSCNDLIWLQSSTTELSEVLDQVVRAVKSLLSS
jgi:nucleoside 2-deoxyribosyltransferase